MGTHPIFESDFDCLTEMSDIISLSESSAEESDKEYEVESILDHRKKHERGANMEYKIRWKGYSKAHDTWEPEDNLDCKDMLADYHKEHPKFEPHVKKEAKKKRKRKRSVTVIKDDAEKEEEIPINELSVRPLSPVATSEISVTESQTLVRKRPRMRVTKKRAEMEEGNDLKSTLSSSKVAMSEAERTEKIPDITPFFAGEIKQPLQPAKTNLPKAIPPAVQAGSDSKENSLPGETEPQTEDQNANSRAVSPMKKPSGFDQGLVPEEIIGATNIGGFKFLLKWKSNSKMEFVDNETAKEKIPLLLIKFYEARVHFDHKDVPLNSPFHPLATGDGNL